jgi:two-component system response regulator
VSEQGAGTEIVMSVDNQKTILIVDDEEKDSSPLQRTLRAAGITNRIVTLRNGADVLLYLKATGGYSDRNAYPLPAALFLDLKMPGVNGFRVLEWLLKHPELRPSLVVALTGTYEFGDAELAYHLGANTFLTKPCIPEDVHNLRQAFLNVFDLPTPSWQASSGVCRLQQLEA